MKKPHDILHLIVLSGVCWTIFGSGILLAVDCYTEIDPYYLDIDVQPLIHIKSQSDAERIRSEIIVNVIDRHLSWRAGKRYEMTMSQAAQRWDRGLPTGNGRVGAMVYGNVANETIILNHDSLFIRSEKPPAIPGVGPNQVTCLQ